MFSTLTSVLLVLSIVLNGLLAGLFFSFSTAVIPGFRRVVDRTYARAFRAINSAILNGVFLAVFGLAPLSAAAALVMNIVTDGRVPWVWLVLGAICSVLTFAVTAVVNVPLNTGLDRADTGTEAGARAARSRFEDRWNRWNHVRTLTSLAALVFFAVALALA
ncbi:anthrone oxygenase family protein [Brevibacterium sp. ZH18]|uniref:anthrone oxygenase family protein n=1 Tax=Brevibacterium sp. ZH18 TaxID=2927784 RepID=UPI001F604521|nr:anthrone oxygenase family protein [Brevibacterium sp. ZH18]MCI4012022.1 DUF1772 domain-containing protein [Brevibacterium sp. ZH18]